MNIKGSIPALITPFNSDLSIDYENLEQLINWHIEQKTDALVIAGTTGESPTINVSEQIALIKFSVEIANGRVPIIAGTGANSTNEAIELTKEALKVKVDACLLVAPYYNKPNQEGLYEHFKAIANAVAIPQILYNVPGRTCSDILPETVGKLSKIKNIIGIKEATGDLSRIAQIKTQLDDSIRDSFYLYTGEDSNSCKFNSMGGDGSISVTANVAPKLNHQMVICALENKIDEAEAIDKKLQGLHKELFCQSNPIPVKWAMSEMGFCKNTLRLPLTPLPSQYHQQVKDAMLTAQITL